MKNNRFVVAVLIPSFIILIVFSLVPVLYGLGISFFDYNPANTSNDFIALENYKRLLTDNVFWIALKNTILYSLITVVANIILSLTLAKLIISLPSKRMRTFFRVAIFLSCIAPIVGTSMIWKYGILGTNGGALNQILGIFAIPPQNWFITKVPMQIILVAYTLWADVGYNTILFSAGLEGIPKEFQEAAIIDGTNSFQRFFKVEFPLIRSTFVFIAIMTMIDYMQRFEQFSILVPSGGRANTAMVLTNYIYRTSFTSFDMGYASAIATALFLLIFVVTKLQNRVLKSDWSYD